MGLVNTLNTLNKQTAKISTSGIASTTSMLLGYLRQRRTMGSFLATAWPLVAYDRNM